MYLAFFQRHPPTVPAPGMSSSSCPSTLGEQIRSCASIALDFRPDSCKILCESTRTAWIASVTGWHHFDGSNRARFSSTIRMRHPAPTRLTWGLADRSPQLFCACPCRAHRGRRSSPVTSSSVALPSTRRTLAERIPRSRTEMWVAAIKIDFPQRSEVLRHCILPDFVPADRAPTRVTALPLRAAGDRLFLTGRSGDARCARACVDRRVV